MLVAGLETIIPVGAVLLFVLHRLSWAPGFQPFGATAARIETDERLVALTFDDGPTALGVEALLPVLAQAKAPATFYLNGVHADARPQLVRRIADAGHEIGNHGYSHRPLAFVRPATVRREVEATDCAIRKAGYAGPITFRPPYGRKLLALTLYLARRRRMTVMWDAAPDHGEWTSAPDVIAAKALAAIRPGSIVLLHPMFEANAHTREALPLLLAGLRARGYRCVTVSDLLRRGRPVRAPFWRRAQPMQPAPAPHTSGVGAAGVAGAGRRSGGR